MVKIPKDLGVKMGTPREAEYARVLRVQEESLVNSKINQEIAEVMIELCKKKIKEEKETFK
tara:strand:+ start:54 stop:236 length:183 start_codon:yes stop_codon:yes gene_type:complete